MLVCFVVADDASGCGTRGAVTGHVAGDATDYGTFDASLAFAGALAPTAHANAISATSIFIASLLEPADISRKSRLLGSFAFAGRSRAQS